MRVVRTPEELPGALESAASEALKAFGDASVYLEKFIERPRHVEIQVLADDEPHHPPRRARVLDPAAAPEAGRGGAVAGGRRRAPRMDGRRRRVAAAEAVGYRGAGTCEFLLAADRSFYFLEMNTRIQVEHPVTELVYGVDLVREQLRIAAGEPMRVAAGWLQPRGWAIECRITSEDPANGFLPSTGRIEYLRVPGGPGRPLGRGRRGGRRGHAALRLDARQADRLGARPGPGDRAHAPRARRADRRSASPPTRRFIGGCWPTPRSRTASSTSSSSSGGPTWRSRRAVRRRRPAARRRGGAGGGRGAPRIAGRPWHRTMARPTPGPEWLGSTAAQARADCGERGSHSPARGRRRRRRAARRRPHRVRAAHRAGRPGRARPRSAAHKRFARARPGRLVERSPDRVEPRCPHYVARRVRRLPAAALERRRPARGPPRRSWATRSGASAGLEVGRSRRSCRGRARVRLPHQDHPGRERRRTSDRAPPLRPGRPGVRPRLVPHHGAAADGALAGASARSAPLLPPRLDDSSFCGCDRAGGLPRAVPGGRRARRGAAARALRGRARRARGQTATIWWQPEDGAPRAMAGAGEAYPRHGVRAGASRHGRPGARPRASPRSARWTGGTVWDLYAGIGETTAALVRAGADGGERRVRPARRGRGRSAEVRPRGATRAGSRTWWLRWARRRSWSSPIRRAPAWTPGCPRRSSAARPARDGLRLVRPRHAGPGPDPAARVSPGRRGQASTSSPRPRTSRRSRCWSRAS